MALLIRYRFTWTGYTGAPGVTTVFGDGAAPTPALAAAWRTFFDANKNMLPSGCTIGYNGAPDIINDTNGALTGVWADTPWTSVVGTSAGNFAPAQGGVVLWDTANYVHGHRVKGRTYLVPLGALATGLGVLTSACVTQIQAAATALVVAQGPNMRVWSRPVTADEATATNPARAGSSFSVASGRITNKMVVLRSRRD